jgi:phosphoribosylformylglycinamidine synthase
VSREFLSSNGAPKHQDVHVEEGGSYAPAWDGDTLATRMTSVVGDLNVASNKGLAERFDSTIGAATVLMPFGGARQLTPSMAMVAKLPVDGETTTVSGMAWGFNPYLTDANQFTGAYLAVVESVSKLVAAGLRHEDAYLSFQEYFERLRDEPERWGKPCAAVLGALMAQVDLGVGAIGGKDSMSGSFEDLDVPPTLVSFATAVGNVDRVTSPEWKAAGDRLVLLSPSYQADGLTPEPASMLATLDAVEALIGGGSARAVTTPGYGCLAESLFKSSLGNRLGVRLIAGFDTDALFSPAYGSFVVEVADDADVSAASGVKVRELGHVTEAYDLATDAETVSLEDLERAWAAPLADVFPYQEAGERVQAVSHITHAAVRTSSVHVARPHVVIPVFPGTNCEYDSARAFERAGADVTTLVIKNLSPESVAQSCDALVREISRSQIVMLPGGFSGGDEPDGSAKFINAFFRAPAVTEAVRDLLQARDGLMLGICNGFQALIKLGLVPYGDIRPMDETCPTLTFNTIGRHQSRLVRTRVASDLSPWLSKCEVGDVHTVAISHGEGRFVASDDMLAQLIAAGQVATQYVDADGIPSTDLDVNPNGSLMCIEGITSPDGRVLGKMGHTERSGAGLYKNVPGDLYQPLIEGGVAYFTE